MKKQKRFKRRIERTNNKHSRAVYRDGTIVIRLARGLTALETQDHIDTLYRGMIEQLMEEYRTKKFIDPFGALFEGAEQATVRLASGKRYIFTLKAGQRTEARRTSYGWTVTVAPKTRRKQLHRFLWKVLADAERPRIVRLVASLNDQTLGISYRRVRFAFASSQWGSCSPKGNIMINAALLFVPPSVLKYVIIHELAHRLRSDHSPSYWRWVDYAMPNYEKAREMLYEYRLPTL